MTPPGDNGSDKQLGEIVSEVSEKATLLVREEIELAKAEVLSKAKTMGRGAGIAGLLAKTWLSSGPPTPDMAIQEARVTKEELEQVASDTPKLPEETS